MVPKTWLFIQALAFFIIGIYLTSMGLPSDEADATLQIGDKMLDSLNANSNSPIVSNITSNSKQGLINIGVGLSIAGVLELVILGLFALKEWH